MTIMNTMKKIGWATAAVASMISFNVISMPTALASSTVTVQPGDTLWKIARIRHTTVAALEHANPSINPSNLKVGTVLQLPNSSSSGLSYTVKSGDSLWIIAHKYGISVSRLQAANPGVSAANLEIGRSLTIPVSSQVSTANYSSTDLYWLEHIIHAEAGSQTQNAKIAVGDVILNRVHSPKYPNTVKSVIFQVANGHYQFTPVLNGYIYSAPSAGDRQAALDVLKNHVNLVPGALVFYTPSKTPGSSWVRQQPVVAHYDTLTFAK